MQISLDHPELKQFVEEQIRTGRFKSPQDVVQGALALLRAHDDLPADQLDRLRAEISVGIDEADAGQVDPWDVDEIAEEVERRYQAEQKGQ